MLRITANVFSGRPNPTWIITDDKETQRISGRLSEYREALAAPDTGFQGLGFRGLKVEVLGDDDASERLPGEFVIANGASPASRELHDTARQIIEGMKSYSAVPLPDHMLTPIDADIQEYVLKRFEIFIGAPFKLFPFEFPPLVTPIRVTVHDNRCDKCEYEESRFNPGFWNNDPQVRYNNNCYNYARNWRTNTFAQPGRASGRWPNPMACADVSAGARSDGLVDRCNCLTRDEYPRRLVALVVDPGYDYHWYRKQQGGFWGHKPGGTAARNVDNSNVVITDPETADRGGYTDFCGYFYAGKSVKIA